MTYCTSVIGSFQTCGYRSFCLLSLHEASRGVGRRSKVRKDRDKKLPARATETLTTKVTATHLHRRRPGGHASSPDGIKLRSSPARLSDRLVLLLPGRARGGWPRRGRRWLGRRCPMPIDDTVRRRRTSPNREGRTSPERSGWCCLPLLLLLLRR